MERAHLSLRARLLLVLLWTGATAGGGALIGWYAEPVPLLDALPRLFALISGGFCIGGLQAAALAIVGRRGASWPSRLHWILLTQLGWVLTWYTYREIFPFAPHGLFADRASPLLYAPLGAVGWGALGLAQMVVLRRRPGRGLWGLVCMAGGAVGTVAAVIASAELRGETIPAYNLLRNDPLTSLIIALPVGLGGGLLLAWGGGRPEAIPAPSWRPEMITAALLLTVGLAGRAIGPALGPTDGVAGGPLNLAPATVPCRLDWPSRHSDFNIWSEPGSAGSTWAPLLSDASRLICYDETFQATAESERWRLVSLDGARGWIPEYQLVVGSAQAPTPDAEPAALEAPEQIAIHDDGVSALAFSPDGRLLASGDRDGLIALWDLSAHRVARTLRGHTGSVRDLTFSPDGAVLVSDSHDETIRWWDVADGRELGASRLAEGRYPEGAAIHPDGSLLFVGTDVAGRVEVWDMASRSFLRAIEYPLAIEDSGYGNSSVLDQVRSLAVSPDGRTLLLGDSHQGTWLIDLAGERQPRPLVGHVGQVWGVAFSPDGRFAISGADDGALWVWETDSGAFRRRLGRHFGAVLGLAVRPDGRLVASVGEDRLLRVWDLTDGREVARAEGAGQLHSVGFSADGRLLAAGDDAGMIVLWPSPDGAAAPTGSAR